MIGWWFPYVGMGLLALALIVTRSMLSDAHKENGKLRARLEDGEVMPKREADPPTAIKRLRQDR